MDRAALGYERKDNAFLWLEDAARAQHLMDEQVKASFAELLDPIAARLNPAHQEMFGDFSATYYWSVHQSEWATDIMFNNPSALARIYPQLVQHGIRTFGSPDVMRFLGHRVPSHGHVNRRFSGEVISDLRDRPEGVRIKHRIDHNSVKLYDKHGCVLRAECTLNDPRPFLVFRRPEGKPDARRDWLPLRRGIADIQRRAALSHKVTERYLDAHAQVSCAVPLGKLTAPLCQPTRYNGQRVRGLNPLRQDDLDLLAKISAAEFCFHGLRNRDLRHRLYGPCPDKDKDRRHSAAVTRKLRLLRAHGLFQKVPKSHRYRVTLKGRTAFTALLAARDATTEKLTQMAA